MFSVLFHTSIFCLRYLTLSINTQSIGTLPSPGHGFLTGVHIYYFIHRFKLIDDCMGANAPVRGQSQRPEPYCP